MVMMMMMIVTKVELQSETVHLSSSGVNSSGMEFHSGHRRIITIVITILITIVI